MSTQERIEILAKSSSSDIPYTVRCYLEENRMLLFCSCRAGDNRMLCKHVKKIIAGDDSILYNRNQKDELNRITNHLQKTQIPSLLLEIEKSEDLLEEAKRNVKKAKKNLEIAALNRLAQ